MNLIQKLAPSHRYENWTADRPPSTRGAQDAWNETATGSPQKALQFGYNDPQVVVPQWESGVRFPLSLDMTHYRSKDYKGTRVPNPRPLEFPSVYLSITQSMWQRESSQFGPPWKGRGQWFSCFIPAVRPKSDRRILLVTYSSSSPGNPTILFLVNRHLQKIVCQPMRIVTV